MLQGAAICYTIHVITWWVKRWPLVGTANVFAYPSALGSVPRHSADRSGDWLYLIWVGRLAEVRGVAVGRGPRRCGSARSRSAGPFPTQPTVDGPAALGVVSDIRRDRGWLRGFAGTEPLSDTGAATGASQTTPCPPPRFESESRTSGRRDVTTAR